MYNLIFSAILALIDLSKRMKLSIFQTIDHYYGIMNVDFIPSFIPENLHPRSLIPNRHFIPDLMKNGMNLIANELKFNPGFMYTNII